MTGQYCTLPLCGRDMVGRHRRRRIAGIIVTALGEIHDAELRQAEMERDGQVDGQADAALATVREALCGPPPAPEETAGKKRGKRG